MSQIRQTRKDDRTSARCVFALFCLIGPFAYAGESRVHFDVPRVVECREVTSDSFRADHASEKLIQLSLEISLVARESSPSLSELFYQVTFPGSAYQIHDYSPRTTLATPFAGTIDVQASRNRKSTWDLEASGRYGLFAQGSGHAQLEALEDSRLSGTLSPPQQLAAVAGTIAGGSGLYFRVRPTAQTTLEGASTFVIVLRVPIGWQGDYAIVTCDATKLQREILTEDRHVSCGRGRYLVSLHLAGDESARTMAHRVVKSETQLRNAVIAEQRRQSNSSASQWTTLIGIRGSDNTRSSALLWADDLMFSGEANRRSIRSPLGPETRRAAESFLAARSQLHKLRGVTE